MQQLEQQLNDIIAAHDATNPQLAAIKAEIIKTKNAQLAYNYAMEFEDESSQLQKIVIKSQNAHLIYLFARDVFGADIEKLEKHIIELQDIQQMQNFADYVEGANRKKIVKKIKQLQEEV